MRRWLFAVTLIFAVSLAAGWQFTPATGDLGGVFGGLTELLEMLVGLPPWQLGLVIFLNNAVTLVMSFALAPLLGLMPLFVLSLNGWLIGAVVREVVRTDGLGYALSGLLPHGIIEVPAFLLAEAAALSFAAVLLKGLIRPETRAGIFPSFVKYAKLLGLAVCLLLPAALVEAFVTPLFIGT